MNYRLLLAAVLVGVAAAAPALRAQPAPSPDAQKTVAAEPSAALKSPTLKVCSDAHNLPQSNDKGEGYENEIAAALAHDLGKKIEYTWFPQRMGFVRNTLRAVDEATHQYKCDLIIGVPKGYDQAATTQPYMRSTYALLVPDNTEFRGFRSAGDVLGMKADRLQQLRIGMFAQTPAADWLLQHGLLDHAVLYAVQSGDPNENPQSIVGPDLRDGKIDAAIVWGPVAGYLSGHNEKSGGAHWVILPFKPDPKIRFDYEMSMGVRRGEQDWQDTLDGWIRAHQLNINAILTAHHVPLLDAQGNLVNIKN
ncbi:MAG TPA: quinoprotein dehydrogenase-associated putative ABC transporter substrate-binding protein [Steroidobacteraceae bacterium]|jgi:quinoprotein dehydrogenase-associated probable ABC transporter substrate-binding protein